MMLREIIGRLIDHSSHFFGLCSSGFCQIASSASSSVMQRVWFMVAHLDVVVQKMKFNRWKKVNVFFICQYFI